MVGRDQLKEPKPLRNYICRSYIFPNSNKMQSILNNSKFQSTLFHKCLFLSDQMMHTELCGAGKVRQKKLRCLERAELR